MASRSVSASRRIAAAPERVFAVLVDPTKHPAIDGSGTVRQATRKGPTRLGPGTRFTMDMHLVVPYRMANKVVEFDEGRRIAWSHVGAIVWRYELEREDDDTTTVTETFDWSASPGGFLVEAFGFPERNRQAMEKSLERLAGLVEEPAASQPG